MDHCIHWYAVVHGWFLLPTPKFHFLAAPSSTVSSHVTVSESNLSSLSLLGPFWTFFSSAFRCRIPNSSTSFFPLHQSQEFAIERHMAGSSSAVLIIRSLSKFAKLPTRPISTLNTYSHLSNGCTSHHFLFHSTENESPHITHVNDVMHRIPTRVTDLCCPKSKMWDASWPLVKFALRIAYKEKIAC